MIVYHIKSWACSSEECNYSQDFDSTDIEMTEKVFDNDRNFPGTVHPGMCASCTLKGNPLVPMERLTKAKEKHGKTRTKLKHIEQSDIEGFVKELDKEMKRDGTETREETKEEQDDRINQKLKKMTEVSDADKSSMRGELKALPKKVRSFPLRRLLTATEKRVREIEIRKQIPLTAKQVQDSRDKHEDKTPGQLEPVVVLEPEVVEEVETTKKKKFIFF